MLYIKVRSLLFTFLETKIQDEVSLKDLMIDKKMETIKVISIKNIENRFAPLYYKRISYRLIKDAKTFNFAVYFCLMNLLRSKKLFYPCVTLVSLFLVEVSSINYDLYEYAKSSQRMECFMYLYEFLIYIQVEMLIELKNFDRALYELLRIIRPINEFSYLIFKALVGLCLSHCFYYDLSTFYLSEAASIIKPLLEKYKTEDRTNQDTKDKTVKEAVVIKKSKESNIKISKTIKF